MGGEAVKGDLGIRMNPVSVDSLRLKEAERAIKTFAQGGASRDLDTPEEFRRAHEVLAQLNAGLRDALQKACVVPEPSVSSQAVLAKEADGLFQYEIGPEGKSLIRRSLVTLQREDLTMYGDAMGKVKALATNGTVVYVLMEWTGNQRVLEVDSGRRCGGGLHLGSVRFPEEFRAGDFIFQGGDIFVGDSSNPSKVYPLAGAGVSYCYNLFAKE